MPTKDDINHSLKQVQDVYLASDIIRAKSVKNIRIDGDDIDIDLQLPYVAKSYHPILSADIETALQSIGVARIRVNITSKIFSHKAQKELAKIDGVKNIIAVASGKGGVGKSTVAVNLALGLQSEGAKVAILDADIYGPSQPKMLGVSGKKPKTNQDGKLLPIVAHGIQSMSVGYLIAEGTPMIWRGPMVTQALSQLLSETLWQAVDYMIIDLPPGTGDTQLTLSQKFPVSGAVIVTTPQDIALLDASKGLKMFEKVSIPILGIVENMSLHTCSKCGHEDAIFGAGGGERMAQQYGANFLAALPLATEIRTATDQGAPSVAQDENSRISQVYREIAKKVSARLAKQPKDSAFPNVVMA